MQPTAIFSSPNARRPAIAYRGQSLIPRHAECFATHLLRKDSDGGIVVEFEYRTPEIARASIVISFSPEVLRIMINVQRAAKISPLTDPTASRVIELVTDGDSAIFSESELCHRLFLRLHRYEKQGRPKPEKRPLVARGETTKSKRMRVGGGAD